MVRLVAVEICTEMRDFTLYVHDIDATRFDDKQSRYGVSKFSEEWERAWASYTTHVHEAPVRITDELREFALSLWRQDLRDPRCIRKKPLDGLVFSALTKTAELRVYNEIVSRTLVLQYSHLLEFAWQDSTTKIALAEALDGNSIPLFSDLRVEEVRFDQTGVIEHEIRFMDGSHLRIRAGSISLNLSDYLSAWN